MQFAKDSLYLAFRERLAAINPDRVIAVAGGTRPAVLVPDNEAVAVETPTTRAWNTFELNWGPCERVGAYSSSMRPLMKLECLISYRTAGEDTTGNDRGHALAALDEELLRMCTPPRTPKRDYTQPEPAFLGTMVFWDGPTFDSAKSKAGELHRTARLSVFYFSEVNTA